MNNRVDSQHVLVLNTLGAALAHYTSELVHDIETSGAQCEVLSIVEPSQSGESSISWLRAYITALFEARRKRMRVVVTWPVLGFLDLLIVHLILGSHGWVIVHDTKPLVKARGYGSFVQRVIATCVRRPFIVHSEQARAAIGNERLRARSVLLAHPMLPPLDASARTGESTVVRVLGQFKPDRDVTALRQISSSLPGHAYEIVGRRWPEVEGWSVRAEFVSEGELEELLRSSSAVVVPYRRFFQSGIAIRCLEYGTAVVGPQRTSMSDLFGQSSALLAGEQWAPAVEYALTAAGVAEVRGAAAAWYGKACRDWRVWAENGAATDA